jgi:hypothetical protein
MVIYPLGRSAGAGYSAVGSAAGYFSADPVESVLREEGVRSHASYDYVIVGAGSAGCVVAGRLGEDRDVRVAVLEAGPPDDDALIRTPLALGQLWHGRFDWDLLSEPEPGLAGRRG